MPTQDIFSFSDKALHTDPLFHNSIWSTNISTEKLKFLEKQHSASIYNQKHKLGSENSSKNLNGVNQITQLDGKSIRAAYHNFNARSAHQSYLPLNMLNPLANNESKFLIEEDKSETELSLSTSSIGFKYMNRGSFDAKSSYCIYQPQKSSMNNIKNVSSYTTKNSNNSRHL